MSASLAGGEKRGIRRSELLEYGGRERAKNRQAQEKEFPGFKGQPATLA
jgi:hypothetical protein